MLLQYHAEDLIYIRPMMAACLSPYSHPTSCNMQDFNYLYSSLCTVRGDTPPVLVHSM